MTKPKKHCEYCDQGGHIRKYCWAKQPNVKKAKRHKDIDDRDNGPPDTFNFMVSKDPISDKDLDDFIRNFSEMTKLN